jgi:proteasome alpha subunit
MNFLFTFIIPCSEFIIAMYSPYDFNQSIAHRAEYVEERLKSGSPVVGLSYDKGVLLFTVRRNQRKVFEIYDQLMFSAIGAQADVEAVRLAAIDFAHQEGFARSPDDVSIQRLVGFVLSPVIKRAFGDPMTAPNVLRAVFAEVGKTPEQDAFFVLNYDGEFSNSSRFGFAAGSAAGEDAMLAELEKHSDIPDLPTALRRAADAWSAGSTPIAEGDASEESDHGEPRSVVWDEGTLEAGVLERDTPRESKFRLLSREELRGIRS